jgi:hypothetical protein
MDARRPLAVVTPTLDGDVLAVLALVEDTMTTGQLHRMLPKFSEDGIRKVLMRLREQGIVLSERGGNAYLYKFNRDHVAADPITQLANARVILLQRIEMLLGSWLSPPVYAAVFGSMARGTGSVHSDVDLFLVRSDEASDDLWASQVEDLRRKVTKWSGNDARPLEFSVAELLERATERVVKDVAEQGLTVFGQRSWFQHQVRVRQ